MFERRTFVFGKVPLVDANGAEVGCRLAITVWQGDDRDRPGQLQVGNSHVIDCQYASKPPGQSTGDWLDALVDAEGLAIMTEASRAGSLRRNT